jgi:hypothetical protein
LFLYIIPPVFKNWGSTCFEHYRLYCIVDVYILYRWHACEKIKHANFTLESFTHFPRNFDFPLTFRVVARGNGTLVKVSLVNAAGQ